VIIFVAFGCKSEEIDDDIIELITEHYEQYAYLREHLDLPNTNNHIRAALAHNERLYYAYFDYTHNTSKLVVTSLNADGSDVNRLEIRCSEAEIASFNITNEGNYAFLFINNNSGMMQRPAVIEYSARYVEYDQDGAELSRRVFDDFSFGDGPQAHSFGISIDGGFTILNDGRILGVNKEKNTIHRLDFNSSDWGDIYPVSKESRRIRGIFPAQESSPYDFLFMDDIYLYGYNIAEQKQTIIFNMSLTGFADLSRVKTGIFDDGRMFFKTDKLIMGIGYQSSIYILTPVDRSELPERITLTLRGVYIPNDIRLAVAAFNVDSPNCKIDIYEYADWTDVPTGDLMFFNSTYLNISFGDALLRFQIDLMAGNIPDIIVYPTTEMIDAGFLLDLNPFINTDPEIDRADFFPNTFTTFERPDGSLPVIFNKFGIDTIVGHSDTFGHIEKWTPEEALSLIHSTQDMTVPFGIRLTRYNLLDFLIQNVDIGFVDMENFRASFDSAEFISFINTLNLLLEPSEIPDDLRSGRQDEEFLRIQTGQQVLAKAYFSTLYDYQMFSEFIKDGVEIGVPASDGGVHILLPSTQIGIGATTDNADGAWSFLKSLLLITSISELYSNSYINNFPVRIDVFNDLVEEATTPWTYVNLAGETIESPRYHTYVNGRMVDLYSMSVESANSLRVLIESAVPARPSISDALWVTIRGDIVDFFNGKRTAQATARLIQNRAETWLSEQKLLAGG